MARGGAGKTPTPPRQKMAQNSFTLNFSPRKELIMNATLKRTVPQAVFDSAFARRAAREGHAAACAELARTPRHLLDESNPNHPRYDLHLFGEHHATFMARQHRP